MSIISTRFAPSPTGYLHIGGARTCLFNWLFARANKGKFILRIEDTDQARSKKEYLDEILDSLKWLGLDWDEIYFQSKRFVLYTDLAKKLLADSKAYEAEDGSGAIILKMPQKTIEINDLVHGKIQFDTQTIKDQVLIKSDGTPTYNFACVVDDADLKITHVLRGDDHISNTPKQVVIYEALGFSLPLFAHIPMILSGEGGRLSKRTGATAISEYKAMGFLPEAIVNYLSLLGWSPKENQEIISKEESIQKFLIKDINDTAAAFDQKKLEWLNNHYLKNMDPEVLLDIAIPFFKQKGYLTYDNFDRKWMLDLVKLFQGRIDTVLELIERSEFFFVDDLELSPEAKAKLQEKDFTKEFQILAEEFSSLKNFEHEVVEKTFRDTAQKLNIKAKILIHPLRAAVTGSLAGPGLFEVIASLGKDRVCRRLNKARQFNNTKGE
ncbi:MAG: glutamate--tRNA ligase [Candidatus Omnitrophota bacterium]